MKDRLPQTGEGVHGEKLGTDYENHYKKLDLGKLYGVAGNNEDTRTLDPTEDQLGEELLGAGLAAVGSAVSGAVEAGKELAGTAVKLMAPPGESSEDAFGTSARPKVESAMDCYQRKFGGNK